MSEEPLGYWAGEPITSNSPPAFLFEVIKELLTQLKQARQEHDRTLFMWSQSTKSRNRR